MSSTLITIVAGVGPGTGAAVAKRFAQSYPVVLLSRRHESFESLAKEINDQGGKAVGISTDVSDQKSVREAFVQIEKEFGGDVGVAAAIFNASGRFLRKPFLELTEDDFSVSLDVSAKGAFYFSQASIPLLLRGHKAGPKFPPTLMFTGATASLRGGAQLSSFASGKFALRALSQSLAREFGPQGIHVSHAIIDGAIDTPAVREYLKHLAPEQKIAAEAIADSYWNLHAQPPTCFTYEIDLRPAAEKW